MTDYPFVSEYEGAWEAFKTSSAEYSRSIRFDDERSSFSVDEANMGCFVRVAADFILTYIKKRELERLSGMLPLSASEKKDLPFYAERYLNDTALLDYSEKAVADSMENGKPFCPEGTLRFRMPLIREAWALAVDKAAEELFLEEDRAELYKLAEALISLTSGRESGEVRLVLYPDGSGVFSSSDGLRIECSPALDAPVTGILCALSPQRLIVYDVAGNCRGSLLRSIRSILGERAIFFVLNEN